jgi:hypothetical protein
MVQTTRCGKRYWTAGALGLGARRFDFAITPGLKFEHEVWLTIGSADDLRARFSSIRSSRK